MFDITVEDVKHSIFTVFADLHEYRNNCPSYPHGWKTSYDIKEDTSHFVLTVKDGRFSLEKLPGKYSSDENHVFITTDVVDYHAPSDAVYDNQIKISRLYKDRSVIGNLIYLKKVEIVSQTTLKNGDRICRMKSYNGPSLVQGKRFFMCNGSVWDIEVLLKADGYAECISKTPNCLHVYGWGYVLSNFERGWDDVEKVC